MFHDNLGVALLHKGSIKASIAVDSDYANARHGLGVAYLEAGRLGDAADALK